jgi:glycosyltransferase involved in cell wall biosynthesis
MPNQRIHSLFLSAWYPHRDDAMSGLFVRKHADAVSRFCKVTVLYVHADEQIARREVRFENYNAVHEVYIYYPSGKGVVRFFWKPLQFIAAYLVGIRKVFSHYGRPNIVHVNILTRTALPALYLKLTRGIPYVITEHWSRYLPTRNSYHGWLRKWLTRKVVRNASALMPVSKSLSEAMQDHGIRNSNTIIVNNVVDDFFFDSIQIDRKTDRIKHILHISCFDDEPKNISGMLRVVAQLYKERSDFRLTLAGTGKDFDKIKMLVEALSIDSILNFTGELCPQEVAKQIQAADFTVLFSNNENAPVVISESLACGKPLVATRVGGIPEMVNELNGLLVEAGDEPALKRALHNMLDSFSEYSAAFIQERAKEKYSYFSIGEAINNIYKKVLA